MFAEQEEHLLAGRLFDSDAHRLIVEQAHQLKLLYRSYALGEICRADYLERCEKVQPTSLSAVR
jgi:hypothetical protein